MLLLAGNESIALRYLIREMSFVNTLLPVHSKDVPPYIGVNPVCVSNTLNNVRSLSVCLFNGVCVWVLYVGCVMMMPTVSIELPFRLLPFSQQWFVAQDYYRSPRRQ